MRLLGFILSVALVAAACGGGGDTDPYVIPSEAMEPTYEVGDIVEVDPAAYESDEPAIGDIVLFNPPAGAETGRCGVPQRRRRVCPMPTPGLTDLKFLKRIVAGPGDTLSIVNGHAVVNGTTAEEDFSSCAPCDMPVEVAIPPGHYFVLGDNRAASHDSRSWGPVPRGAILGRIAD